MTSRARLRYLRPAATIAVLLAGLFLRELGAPGSQVWLMAGLAITGAPIVWQTGTGMLRGRFAADIIASLSIVAALLLSQPIAGLVIVLMQSGGEALEQFAAGRASAAVRELEARAPRIAHRLTAGTVEDLAAEAVRQGDLLLVRPGELVPCDSEVVSGSSHVDTSSLTGEPVPVRATCGHRLLSGSLNQEGALTVRALATAGASQYARIVELVRSAAASKAPLQRLADRYAVWLTPAVIAVSAATWIATGDATRMLAVLVIATPCPLILATPVAIIGGINSAARAGIIVRSGSALEQLSEVDHVVFDKTGTLTIGRPLVQDIATASGLERGQLLQRIAAVEAASSHLLARSIVSAIGDDTLPPAAHVVEVPGRGVRGEVGGSDIAVGSLSYVTELVPASADGFRTLATAPDGLRAYVVQDGRAAAVITFADQARPDMIEALAELRAQGIDGLSLVSGDNPRNVADVAAQAGIRDAHGDLLAEDKVSHVRALQRRGRRVMMVGDGTNDAPALTAADVGVVLAEHGGGISAEAADIIVLRDNVRLVPQAVAVSRRTLRIARQSIQVGLGLSAVGMVAAAFGVLAPTAGALAQEAIDLAVILNAIRTASDPGARSRMRQSATMSSAAPDPFITGALPRRALVERCAGE